MNKAPGEDRISYDFFVNAPDSFLEELSKSYNFILNTGIIDDCFIKSVIFLILKKGNPNLASNYRGISFMNCIAKILMGVINTRLTEWIKKHAVMNDFQAGVRKNYSTVDNIFNLAPIVNLKFEERKKTYAIFVNFRAAFDKVPRTSLIYKLRNIGFSTKITNFIENVYRNTKSGVWTGEELSNYFETIKEGCLLSPLLFALYLNDLHDFIGGGLNIGELNI